MVCASRSLVFRSRFLRFSRTLARECQNEAKGRSANLEPFSSFLSCLLSSEYQSNGRAYGAGRHSWSSAEGPFRCHSKRDQLGLSGQSDLCKIDHFESFVENTEIPGENLRRFLSSAEFSNSIKMLFNIYIYNLNLLIFPVQLCYTRQCIIYIFILSVPESTIVNASLTTCYFITFHLLQLLLVPEGGLRLSTLVRGPHNQKLTSDPGWTETGWQKIWSSKLSWAVSSPCTEAALFPKCSSWPKKVAFILWCALACWGGVGGEVIKFRQSLWAT